MGKAWIKGNKEHEKAGSELRIVGCRFACQEGSFIYFRGPAHVPGYCKGAPCTRMGLALRLNLLAQYLFRFRCWENINT